MREKKERIVELIGLIYENAYRIRSCKVYNEKYNLYCRFRDRWVKLWIVNCI